MSELEYPMPIYDDNGKLLGVVASKEEAAFWLKLAEEKEPRPSVGPFAGLISDATR